jgi:O-antigen/teichoic acid export membrane protein
MCAIYAQMVEIIPVGISISERTYHYTWIIVIAALTNLVLNFLVIPRWGFFGAAITTLIAYIVYYVLSDIISSRYLNSAYPRVRINIYLVLVFAISLFFPLMEIFKHQHYSLAIKILCFVVATLLPLLFRFITLKQVHTLVNEIIALPKRIRNKAN